MQARFRRTERDPERDGNLGQWQVEVVVKDDEGPRLRFETAEAAFELVAVGGRGRAVIDGMEGGRGQFDVEAVPPKAARLVDAGADEQAVKPGVEVIGAAQCGQVTPGPDERLLDGVLGLVGIAQDEPGGGVQPEDRGACQRGEGVMIGPVALAPRVPAASRPSAAARPTWSRSMSMARQATRIVPNSRPICAPLGYHLPPRPSAAIRAMEPNIA